MSVQVVGADGHTRDKAFILDTGCNASLVTDTLAQDLGLKPQPAYSGTGNPFHLNGASLQAVTVPNLHVGSLQVSDIPCVITSAKGLAGATGQAASGVIHQSVDGVIGNNLLVAFPALIDFRRNEVTFFRPGPLTPADLRAVGMDAAIAVPLDTDDDSYIYTCRTQLDAGGHSIKENLEIDIGSATTMINGQDARNLGLPMKEQVPITTVTGQTNMYSGRVTGVTLGDGTTGSIFPVQAIAVAYPKGKLPDFLPPRLGRDVLSHYRVLLDFQSKKMYLAPLTLPIPDTSATPAMRGSNAPDNKL